MRSVFSNPTIPTRQPVTQRQRNYLNSRKTDRPRNKKPEQELQKDLCLWIKETLPGVHFRSDTASGAFNSRHEKNLHTQQQSSDSEPDVMIFAACRGYHGLLIELKADGVDLRMRQNGRTIRVFRNAKGKITGRDYKIRKKGDWASLHIEKQANTLLDYERKWGYCARFAVGIEHAKKLISWYFDIPYVENTELF